MVLRGDVFRDVLLAHRGSLVLLYQLHALGRAKDVVRHLIRTSRNVGGDYEDAGPGSFRKSTRFAASGANGTTNILKLKFRQNDNMYLLYIYLSLLSVYLGPWISFLRASCDSCVRCSLERKTIGISQACEVRLS
jgi:hypothetical protein